MSPDPRSPSLLAEIANDTQGLDQGSRGPTREVRALREHGWLSAVLPVDYGGSGWGQSADGAQAGFAALFSLGSVSLPTTRIFEGHLNTVRLIDRHGTPDQRRTLFDQVQQGALLGIWGADGDRPVTIMGEDADRALAGAKAFSSGLGEVAVAIVTASDVQGACQMVLVPATDRARHDPSAWDVSAMVGTCSGTFSVDQLPVDRATLLGAPDALFIEPDFNGGVWRLCAAYAGGMAAIAQFALDHAQHKAGDEDPQTRARLGQVALHAQTALLWARHACRAVELPTHDVASAGRAMAASLFAREAIERAANEQMAVAERIAGTSLHRRGSALGRHVRDLRFFLRQAALDAKLDTAFAIWSDDPRSMQDDMLC